MMVSPSTLDSKCLRTVAAEASGGGENLNGRQILHVGLMCC